MDDHDHSAALDAAIAATAAPLRETYDEIDRDLREAEQRVKELRALRHRARLVLNQLDPEFAAVHGVGQQGKQNAKPKAGTSVSGLSQERRNAVLDAARTAFGDRPFDATDLHPIAQMHRTTVNKFLREEHLAGRLLLDHRGGPRGTTKFYRLPPKGDE